MYLGQAETAQDAQGNIYYPDGTVIGTDGTIAFPDGSTMTADGRMVDVMTGGDATSSISSWLDTLQKIATIGIMTDAQRKLLQINLNRAQQGQQPISLDQAGMGVSVGLTQSTRQQAYILGFAALAVLLLFAMRR